VNIGKLDHRLRIEQKSVSQESAFGSQAVSRTTFATVWGEVQDVLPSRAEQQGDGVRIQNRPSRVRIRYLSGLTSDMRVIDTSRSNREMRIVSGPVEMGRQEGMEFMAETYTTQGNQQ